MSAEALSQDGVIDLRNRARQASRIVVDATGHRLIHPVFVIVEGDSTDVALGGFVEGLVEAGMTPRVGAPEASVGTLMRIRIVTLDTADDEVGFDVRVERFPERTMVYSRLLTLSEAERNEEGEGVLDRLLIPAAAIGAAALVIYLLFTVRS